MVSDIPFAGPVGAVRVGRVDGKFVANPTHSERAESDLTSSTSATRTTSIMIEGAADEMPEEEFIKALEFAQEHVRAIVAAAEGTRRQGGKPKRAGCRSSR